MPHKERQNSPGLTCTVNYSQSCVENSWHSPVVPVFSCHMTKVCVCYLLIWLFSSLFPPLVCSLLPACTLLHLMFDYLYHSDLHYPHQKKYVWNKCSCNQSTIIILFWPLDFLSPFLSLCSVQSPGAGMQWWHKGCWGKLQSRALAAPQFTGSHAVGSAPTSAQASGEHA